MLEIAEVWLSSMASIMQANDIPRNYDSPSYTLLPFIPPPAKSAYLSLRALNVSLAQIGDSTSAPAVGAMRMQFWRDTITKALALTPPKEPVAILLAHAAGSLAKVTDGKSKLSKSWLHRIVNEREKYLQNPPYMDLGALETYAENTYSTLLYLNLQALPMASITADHVASHIGKAQGIAAVLRGIPLLAFPGEAKHHSAQTALGGSIGGGRQGTVTLPLDVMSDAGVREEEVMRKGSEAQGLRDAVFQVATRASDHLITAREMVKNLRAGRDAGHEYEHADDIEHQGGTGRQDVVTDVDRSFGVYMPAISTQMWLDKLQKCDFDVFNSSLRQGDWKLPFKAYWAFNRKQI